MRFSDLRQIAKQTQTTFLDWIFPPKCLLCDKDLEFHAESQQAICDRCDSQVKPVKPPACLKCGYPLGDHVEIKARCDQCRNSTLWFDRSLCAGLYKDGFETLVKAFKFQRRFDIAPFLAKSMAAKILEQQIQNSVHVALCVPPRPGSVAQRGFHPPQILAKLIAKRLQIPLISNALYATRRLQPQHLSLIHI